MDTIEIPSEEKLDLVKSLKAVVDRVLKLDSNDEDEELQYCFKVLIFDDYVFDIICPLLKVYTLRENNITLHMNIKDNKERVSDVMAIYIVRPSEENFKLIKKDLEKRVFDNYYINLVEKCDEGTLQAFFSDLIQTDNYNRIYKIAINPIGFFVYHPSVFSLNIPSPYSFLNSPKTQEWEINNYFEKVGNGIFNTLFTMKTVPIIKYRTGWFAENIITVIQNNFKQTFDKFPELTDDFPRKNNTLLVILDRDTDLPIMLHHSASLGAMLNDIFGIVRTKTNSSNRFEIDPVTDYIWNSCLSTSFVLAKEKILEELKKITQEHDYLASQSKSNEELEKISEKLNSTLEGLRDTTIKQGVLNNHATFQDKMSKQIDDRRLGPFYELEESALNKRSFSTRELKQKFYDLITLKSIKISDINISKNDILRLCLMYYLINNKVSQEEMNEIEKALKNVQQSTDALDYLKQKRAFEESMKKGNSSVVQESGFLQKSVSFFVNRIGSLMNTEQPSITADILTSLANNREVSNFVSCHALKKGLDRVNYSFNQIIVFMVGGGSLSEYEYVDEVLSKNGKNVIYGCDYLYRPTEFVQELEKLKYSN